MPLYDYKCTKCGYLFEVQQRISEEPLKHCPKCKGEIRRVISPSGIIFKGSGFHVTDYGKRPQTEDHRPKTEKEKSKEKGSSKGESSPPPSK